MYVKGLTGKSMPAISTPKPQEPSTSLFTDAFQKASSALNEIDKEALHSQLDLLSGNARDMHTAVLTAEKASLALDLVVSVRNRALEAYQEIMRMPL